MARKKVIVYFLHEYQLAKAISIVKENVERTEGFVKGEVSSDQLRALENSNLIYQVIEEDKHIDTPGTIGDNFNSIHGFAKEKNLKFQNILTDGIITHEAVTIMSPGIYLIKIDGPLMESYKKKFEELNISLLQYYPENSYTAFLKEDDIKNLYELPFVLNVSHYGSRESGVRELKLKTDEPFMRAVPEENYTAKTSFTEPSGLTIEKDIPAKSYDIYLHAPTYMEEVINWLKEKHIVIRGSSKYKIRAVLPDDLSAKKEVSANPFIQSITEYVPPGLHIDLSRTIINLETQNSAGVKTDILNQDGTGQLIGIADSGIDARHGDFAGKINIIIPIWPGNNGHTDPLGHGTHIAGIIAGNGSQSGGVLKGIASGAQIYFQSLLNKQNKIELPVNLTQLYEEAYLAGVRIHNNSWGSNTQGVITADAVEIDDFVNEHKDMLLVFSAGNNGVSTGPANTGYVDFDSIGSPATAKNVLTVGASRSSRNTGGHSALTYGQVWQSAFTRPPIANELVSGNPDAMAAFSGRGPCDDYRFKPDIVAPGTDIVSVRSGNTSGTDFCGDYPNNPGYAMMCGTSMAAPIVTACAALVRQYFNEVLNNPNPSAALLKVTLINGTKQLGSIDSNINEPVLPNNHQGFGIVDMEFTIPNKKRDFFLHYFDISNNADVQLTGTGKSKRYKIKINQGGWIRVCMAYTDAHGRALQNNLNLLVDNSRGDTWVGNKDSNIPHNRFPDPLNNVEIIRIPDAKAGDTYTIKVIASNLTTKSPQDFALIITAEDQNAYFLP